MKRPAKRTAVAAVMSAAVTAFLTAGTGTAALAIGQVPCGPSDYLQVEYHVAGGETQRLCLANGGEWSFGYLTWITRISTGNNRVQWFGDGRWQPDPPYTPIEKWSVFTWPNHPGGVEMRSIRIV